MAKIDLKNITHIELDMTIVNKPVIKLFANDRLDQLLHPKTENAEDLFREINKAWFEIIKENNKK